MLVTTRTRAAILRNRLDVVSGIILSLVPSIALALNVTISGEVDEDLRSELENGSLLFDAAEAEQPPDVREIVSAAQADYRRMLAIFYDNGYFGPSISIKLDGREAADIPAISPPNAVSNATITVVSGRAFRFGRTEIGPTTPAMRLPEGFAPGEPARVSEVQSAARATVSGWRDAGHAKASVADQKITARHDEQKLDVDVTIDPGPKLRFGPLTVEGKSKVRRERIYEIAALPEGEVFSPKELEDAAARLRRTGAFRSVAVIEEEVASDGETMPITASVVDNKPRRLGFGAEFATIEGLTLNAFWLHRNLFGGAERLRIDGFYGGIGGDNGGIDYGIDFRFDRPATFSADTGFYAKLQLEHIDDPNVESDTAAVEMGAEWRRSDEQTYRLGAGLRHSDTKDALDDTKYTTFYIPAGLTFDYRNNELDARRGYYLNYDTAPFLALSGIDSGFYNKFDLRGYRSFNVGNARATTLALRLQLGSLAGPSLEDAPSDFLFYSGGGGTVRGHDYQSLGVQVGSDDDDIVGGRSFLGISTEVRFRTQGALGFVGFFDAGYIGRKSFPDGSGEWHTGAGLGVRYATPIGPIRFDFAVPTSNNNGDNNFQLYFGIGQAF